MGRVKIGCAMTRAAQTLSLVLHCFIIAVLFQRCQHYEEHPVCNDHNQCNCKRSPHGHLWST